MVLLNTNNPEDGRMCLLSELGDVEVHYLSYNLVYEDIRHVVFTEMTLNKANFLWMGDYDKFLF